jgi:ABC-type uncharacterized transport system permease subunit
VAVFVAGVRGQTNGSRPVQIASQIMSMLPYLATIIVLVLITRNQLWIRVKMPTPVLENHW